MGPDERTWSDEQADAFFAQFIDAAPEVIAAVVAERGGDLAAVVAEDRAYGYETRRRAARAERRAARQRVEAAARMREIAAGAWRAHPDESARLAPLPAESMRLLPAPRLAQVSEVERRDSRRWWAGFTQVERRRTYGARLEREARRAVEAQRVLVARARSRAERWRLEQRAFERGQWQQVREGRAARRRRMAENPWTAISEERALQIAIAAMEGRSPQAGK